MRPLNVARSLKRETISEPGGSRPPLAKRRSIRRELTFVTATTFEHPNVRHSEALRPGCQTDLVLSPKHFELSPSQQAGLQLAAYYLHARVASLRNKGAARAPRLLACRRRSPRSPPASRRCSSKTSPSRRSAGRQAAATHSRRSRHRWGLRSRCRWRSGRGSRSTASPRCASAADAAALMAIAKVLRN